MREDPVVIFVCEHGAAKSLIAAAHFNQLANERGLNLRAVARGTNPDLVVSEPTIKGLSKDGLVPTASAPQKLSLEDVKSAQRVVSFCELPIEYKEKKIIEQWDGIPPVSENYDKARDAIIERLNHLLDSIRSSS